jgi:hypothetical protein
MKIGRKIKTFWEMAHSSQVYLRKHNRWWKYVDILTKALNLINSKKKQHQNWMKNKKIIYLPYMQISELGLHLDPFSK